VHGLPAVGLLEGVPLGVAPGGDSDDVQFLGGFPRRREVVHQECPHPQQALGLDRQGPGLREAVRRLEVLGHPLQAQLIHLFLEKN